MARVRKSDGYRQARDAVVELLAKIDEQDAKKACAQKPAQNQ